MRGWRRGRGIEERKGDRGIEEREGEEYRRCRG